MHEYSNDFLDSDEIVNVYFTTDVDAKNRVRDLNEYNRIDLNEIRRKNMQNDGFLNIRYQSRQDSNKYSNLDVDNNVVSVDSSYF